MMHDCKTPMLHVSNVSIDHMAPVWIGCIGNKLATNPISSLRSIVCQIY